MFLGFCWSSTRICSGDVFVELLEGFDGSLRGFRSGLKLFRVRGLDCKP